ncbi:flagellar biosynthetic protein FliO [Paenibacillus sp. YN15]|uniref:flagellar biosynthetic protein FliO n=1 Tax=Paenibacillus sp. YN15 TaxID=1742774 RepID=UPI000DCDF67E|nr:flagellar biosynthetic protein FliO [Paenibacillus sp. YN15]RAV03523.1 flagellar protein [Paenibacillus sp. YN15]
MKRVCKGLLAAGACVLHASMTAGISYAQEGDGLPELQNGSSLSVFWMILKVILFLVVIIGIFLVIMKTVSQKGRLFRAERSLRTIGGIGLGQNKSVQLVQIGRTLYVLGVGEEVGLVDKIEDEEEIQFILDNLHSGSAANTGAASTVGSWLRRFGRNAPSSEELDVTPSFQAVFQEKMLNMANRQKKVEELITEDRQNPHDRLDD